MATIFHITTAPHWEQALQSGIYRVESLITEGFIHCSTRQQVGWVAERFYRAQADLILLTIDEGKVQVPVRYEPPSEDATSCERFPHIYGPLNVDAVTAVTPLPLAADGAVQLPW
ncbi:MAG: DUF952 domain-containing protein [Chloroflexaceae bacterium]|nr:DUF952 domain-containing protein [Chloroflexaceae bacterium]NJO07069.1 DUF952 domain-containing protein [Chloroflexaceae bacterium]